MTDTTPWTCHAEDYALIGDLATAALVGRDGSIDWMCLPRFDSPACFAALLGGADRGRWRIAPADARYEVRRRYREASVILETYFRTARGQLRLVDFMPPRNADPRVVRIVEGLDGRVDLTMDLRPRFGYGVSVPAAEEFGGVWRVTAGADKLWLHCAVHVREDGTAAFSVGPGERLAFVLTWRPSYHRTPVAPDAASLLAATERYWSRWAAGLRYAGEWREEVVGSLVVIHALSYESAGSVLAAPTSFLREAPGAPPTADHRCCRLGDASATIDALLHAGVVDDAVSWRDWLLRATAGPPEQIQGVYGPAGERYRPTTELDWMSGHTGTHPPQRVEPSAECGWSVAAGELLRATYLARREGVPSSPLDSAAFLAAFERLATKTDRGVWGIAGSTGRYVHSRATAWAGADAMVKMIEWFGLPGDSTAWRRLRALIHAQVMRRGVDRSRGTFVQAYGRPNVDAALLRLPAIGFLPPDDPLVLGTIRAVREELTDGSLVRRYAAPAGACAELFRGDERAHVACSFWLVEALAIANRVDEAREIFEASLRLRTDLGLLTEEHDVRADRPVGNFPAASAHVALVGAALRLDDPTRRAGSGLDVFFPR